MGSLTWASLLGLALLLELATGQVIFITGTIRDFQASHADFGRPAASENDVTGLVQTNLVNGKPVRSGTSASGISDFGAWYASPDTNLQHMVPYTLRLSPQVGSTQLFEFIKSSFYPINGIALGNEGGSTNPYFTAEFTTIIRRPIQGNTDVSLEFGSADDMWVFVNDVLAVDMGGIHGAKNGTLRLRDFLATGQEGVIKIFYAHRSSAHAPYLKVTSLTVDRCDVSSSGTRISSVYPFVAANNTQLVSSWASVDNVASPVVLNLLPANEQSIGAAAWHASLLPVTFGFHTSFRFRITADNSQAEGFAFVVQRTGTDTGGLEGGNLFYNIPKSLAIEFDTYADSWDPLGDNNHVSVHTRYASTNSPDHGTASVGTGSFTSPNMDDGAYHTAEIQYLPGPGSSTTGSVSVSVDGVQRVSASVDDTQLLNAFTDGVAYVGFTASSSSTRTAKVEIDTWKLWLVDVSAARSDFTTTLPSGVVATNTPISANTFRVQARDACGSTYPLSAGSVGTSLLSGSTPLASSTSSSDLNNGQYDVSVFYHLIGSYQFSVKLGGLDIGSSPATLAVTAAAVSASESTFTGQNLGSATAGDPKTLTITAKDRFGNLQTDENAVFTVQYVNGAPVSPNSVSGSSYTVQYTATTVGNFALFVRLVGQDIVGSPLPGGVTVQAGPYTTLRNYVASGPGLLGAVAGVPTSFSISLFDNFNNPILSDAQFTQPGTVTVVTDSSDFAANRTLRWNATTFTFDVGYTATIATTYRITVTLQPGNLFTVFNQPVSVEAGQLSTSRSTITLPSAGTVFAGASAQVTISANDIFGNPRSTRNPANEYFNVSITLPGGSEQVVHCEAPSGVPPVANSLSGTCNYANGGRYTLTFVPSTAGVHTIVVRNALTQEKVGGPTSSYTVSVSAGGISSAHSSMSTLPGSISAGTPTDFTVTARDASGNVRSVEDDTGLLSVSLIHKTQAGVVGSVNSISRASGIYTVSWSATVAGDYTVGVAVGGNNIVNSPQTGSVQAGSTHGPSTLVAGVGSSGGVGGSTTNFTVQARDANGNLRLGATTDNFACTITAGNGTVQNPARVSLGDGLYSFQYEVPAFLVSQQTYQIQVTLDATPVFTNTEARVAQNADASFAIAASSTLNTAVAGVSQSFLITDRDSGGTPIPYDPNVIFTVSITGPETVSGQVQDLTNGSYAVTYLVQKKGMYQITVNKNGFVPTDQSPIALTVSAGALSHTDSSISGLPATVVAGQPYTYTVFPKDSGKNLITGSSFTFTLLWEPPSKGPSANNISQVANMDGSYSITFIATQAVSDLSVFTLESGTKIGAGSGEFKVVVIPGPASHQFSTFGTVSSAVAGTPDTFQLVVKDRFQNPVESANVSFSISLEKNAFATFTPRYKQIPGLFDVTYLATNSSATSLALTVLINGLPIQGSPAGLIVQPDVPDPSKSFASGIVGVKHLAAQTMSFTITLRDKFNNNWKDAAGSLSMKLISGPSRGTILFSFLELGQGRYTARWSSPQISSFDKLPATNYTIQLSVDDVVVPLAGLVPFPIYAGRVAVSKTVMPPFAPSTFAAGTSSNVTLQLKDVALPGNLKREGGDQVRAIMVADGGVSNCPNGDIDPAQIATSNFTAPLVRDNNDGTYTVTALTTLAGKYGMRIEVLVNGVFEKYNLCTQLERFTVVPGPPSGRHSVYTLPSSIQAGTPGSFIIRLRDQYNNDITEGSHTVRLDIDPSDVTLNCPSSNGFPRFSTNASLGLSVSVVALGDGTYRVDYSATKATTYRLVGTVNGQFIGFSTQCPTLTVNAAWPYRFESVNPSQSTAATSGSFAITTYDKFDNLIRQSSHTFNVAFDRFSGREVIASYTVGAAVSRAAAATEHTASYISSWGGFFNASIDLQDPTNEGRERAFTNIKFNIRIFPATCAALSAVSPYRCPSGTCRTSYRACPDIEAAQYCTSPKQSFCNGVCSDSCTCPSGTKKCSVTGNCVPTSERCPPAASLACPLGFTHRCNSSSAVPTNERLCRASAADCPSPRVCPPGLVMCSDGVSCARTASACTAGVTSCSSDPISGLQLTYRCPDGRCVDNRDDCPTPPTCANTSLLVCPDGSCTSSRELCPNQYTCEGSQVRCADGSCRAAVTDCPTQVTCPVGWVRCESGQCAQSSAACSSLPACPLDRVRCFDGSCRPNLLLCPTGVTCSASNPVKCANGQCVRTLAECPAPTTCPSDKPQRCPDGSCVASIDQCATGITCPGDLPVLCGDFTCVSSAAACVGKDGLACPPHLPIKCAVGGVCRSSVAECPSTAPCSSTTPVRCEDGRCAVAREYCVAASKLACPTGQVRCPLGGCALGIGLCPSVVACPTGTQRCIDGSCRSSCSSSSASTARQCQRDEVTCPVTNAGTACAASISECPQGRTCPADYPVQCPDHSCVAQLADCPRPAEINSIACPGGGYAKSLTSCGFAVTCPASYPVKCWDQTCRRVAKDCPPQPACPTETPYMCADGSCFDALDLCAAGSEQKCTSDKPIKCPWFNRKADQCVESVDKCLNLFNTSVQVSRSCPNSWVRCRDGSCRKSLALCSELKCPFFLPTRCLDGSCAVNSFQCPADNGCPYTKPVKCWNGACVARSSDCSTPQNCTIGTRCPDGSCSDRGCVLASGCGEGQFRCADGTCVLTQEECTSVQGEANLCPPSRPYRCSSGLCAISSSLCPIIPTTNDACDASLGEYVRCADGSCAASSAQCRLVFPCSGSTDTRCNDGVCRASEQCPEVNTCPSATPVRCAESGLCAKSAGACFNATLGCQTGTESGLYNKRCTTGLGAGQCVRDLQQCGVGLSYGSTVSITGCPANQVKCYDGRCVPSTLEASACGHESNGCPATSAVKCLSGACAPNLENCPEANLCPRESPFRCANGVCVSDVATCPSTTCSGVLCPATGECAISNANCSSTNGCGGLERVRCADGTCRRYPSTALAYGAAAADVCFPTPVCHSLTPALCADGSCAAHASLCRPLHPCPTGMLLCPDRTTCSSTITGCPTDPATACPPSNPTLCPDGSCVRTVAACNTGTNAGIQGACSGATPWTCFDGSCAASPSGCRSWATQLFGGRTCSQQRSGDSQCWNGQCVPAPGACPVHPGCAAGQRICPDGACYAADATCPAVSACPGGTSRCSDGSCAAPGQCPPSSACGQDAPVYCPSNALSGGATCITVGSTCRTDYTLTYPRPCVSNCYRDVAAKTYTSTIHVDTTTSIDVAVNQQQVATARLRIPSGALSSRGTSSGSQVVSTFRVSPVPQSQLFAAANVVHETLTGKYGTVLPFASTVVSSAFQCKASQNGLLRFPLQFEAYYDATQIGATNEETIAAKDLCLGRIDSLSSQWVCIDDTYEYRVNSTNYVLKNDGRPRNLLIAPVPLCTLDDGSAISYAFIFRPLQGEPTPPDDSSSYFSRNRAAILGGLFGSLAFVGIMAYVGWRLDRYRRKFRAKEKELAELERRKAEIEEFGGGIGVAGDDIEMTVNPLVLQMNELEAQLQKVDEDLGVQTEMDERRIDALTMERQRLREQIAETQRQIDSQRQKGMLQSPALPTSGALPTSFAISYGGAEPAAVRTSSGRHEFGPMRTKKKKNLI